MVIHFSETSHAHLPRPWELARGHFPNPPCANLIQGLMLAMANSKFLRHARSCVLPCKTDTPWWHPASSQNMFAQQNFESVSLGENNSLRVQFEQWTGTQQVWHQLLHPMQNVLPTCWWCRNCTDMSTVNFCCLVMAKNKSFEAFTPDPQEERPLRTSHACWHSSGCDERTLHGSSGWRILQLTAKNGKSFTALWPGNKCCFRPVTPCRVKSLKNFSEQRRPESSWTLTQWHSEFGPV